MSTPWSGCRTTPPPETRVALPALGGGDLPGVSDAGLQPRYRLREALATASRTSTPYDRAGLAQALLDQAVDLHQA